MKFDTPYHHQWHEIYIKVFGRLIVISRFGRKIVKTMCFWRKNCETVFWYGDDDDINEDVDDNDDDDEGMAMMMIVMKIMMMLSMII